MQTQLPTNAARKRTRKIFKEKGIVKPISLMSQRAQRKQRNIWVKNTKTYRQRLVQQDRLLANTPPTSGDDDEDNDGVESSVCLPLSTRNRPKPNRVTSQRQIPTVAGLSRSSSGRKRVCRNRSKLVRDNLRLKSQLTLAQRLGAKYKKRIQRSLQKLKPNCPSTPRNRVRALIGSSKVEEIETLCSIYGSDWMTEDEASRAYSITIKEGKHHVTMFITLPVDYPQCCPPTYELLAPELSGYTKRQMNAALDHVYLENIGEPVIFQWVEKIRDILQTLEGHNPAQDGDSNDHLEEETEMCSPAVYIPPSDVSSDASKTPASKTVLIKHGPVITDRKSVFQGHAATVHSVEQVKEVLEILKENKKIANATHNMFAYRIAREGISEAFLHDCEDDGETQAGTRLLHLLQVVGAVNALVVVTRWYGGVHLGPDRFRHINNAARQALSAAGLIAHKHKTTH